jgi:PPM family protein phosphatase
MSEPAIYLSVAARTDVGRVRKKNEDSFVVADLTGGALLGDEPVRRFPVAERGVLLAVSDGMGGEAAGDVASALVVETLQRELAAGPPDAPRDAILEAAVQKAHKVVWKAADGEKKGMGATCTAVFVRGRHAFIAEVGDSRAYVIRGGRIKQLTHDQSMVQMLLDQGIIDPANVEQSPFKSVILQAMGHQKAVKVALAKLQLRSRDCLLLCSDGLTRTVSDEEIRDVILKSPRLDAACEALVNLANERGGEDNITVITAGIGGQLTPSSPEEGISRTFQILESFDEPSPASTRPSQHPSKPPSEPPPSTS